VQVSAGCRTGEGMARGPGAPVPYAQAAALVRDPLRRLRRRRDAGGLFAVACLSIDQAELVEAALGPTWSELLAATVGQRLVEHCGASMVAPLGDGRFAVLLREVGDAAAADRAVDAIQVHVGEAVALGRHDVFPTFCAGVALAHAGYVRPEDVLRDARAALRHASRIGQGSCEVFDAPMQAEALEAIDLEAAIRRGLDSGEFALHYQPIVCLEAGRITGFEALLRWPRLGGRTMPPSAFLPMAEACGQIVPLGRWALRAAAEQVRRWRALPGVDPGLTVNVNLSARQLQDPGLVGDVEGALEAAGIPGNALRLELTESALMESGQAAVDTLCRLKALGVSLCIDDFGVGYSSLSYLHRFPVDVLKIDRSFIGRLGTDPESDGIVEAVVALARGLGMLVVPEGVETADQLAKVRGLECDFAQGYLFSPPVPAARAEELLVSGRAW
jgi:EAL domain-containing protein (putative c-di-GMP-specific phosphodiesterase class I)/GGDEF domain-containing protein